MSPVDPLMQPVTNQAVTPSAEWQELPEPVQTKSGLSTKQKVAATGVSAALSLTLVVGTVAVISKIKADRYQAYLKANSRTVIL